MTRAAVVAVALLGSAVLAGTLAGCGSGGDGRFDDEVSAVRDAVEAGDGAAADQALQALAVDALAARGEGVIDEAELQEVAELIEASRAELAQLVPSTTTTTTTDAQETTTTAEAPPPPVVDVGGDEDHERGGNPDKPGKGEKDEKNED